MKRKASIPYPPPGGESRPDVALRVQSFLGTLTRDYRQKNVLIVCQSVVVLIFRRLLGRWGETDYLKVDKEEDVPKTCSLTIYDYDRDKKKLVLKDCNAICYLDADWIEGSESALVKASFSILG